MSTPKDLIPTAEAKKISKTTIEDLNGQVFIGLCKALGLDPTQGAFSHMPAKTYLIWFCNLADSHSHLLNRESWTALLRELHPWKEFDHITTLDAFRTELVCEMGRENLKMQHCICAGFCMNRETFQGKSHNGLTLMSNEPIAYF